MYVHSWWMYITYIKPLSTKNWMCMRKGMVDIFWQLQNFSVFFPPEEFEYIIRYFPLNFA
jgi:hypothetical protein